VLTLQAEAEDAEYPDEVDTPQDVAARVRFAKYRCAGYKLIPAMHACSVTTHGGCSFCGPLHAGGATVLRFASPGHRTIAALVAGAPWSHMNQTLEGM
jgi:hypothetical protein